jgi:DNA-binding SARP family transcriptional activator
VDNPSAAPTDPSREIGSWYELPEDTAEVPDWLVNAELIEDTDRLDQEVEVRRLFEWLQPPRRTVAPERPERTGRPPVGLLSATTGARARVGGRRHSAFSPDVLVEARILGPVEVAGWRRIPERQVVTELCCYLALHGERPVTADVLLAALWPEGRREAGAKSLRTYLSLLRRSLGPDLFPEAEKGAGYRLDPAVSTDWFSFATLRHDADAYEAHGDAATAALLLRRALQLVRGTPFTGVPAGSYSWAWTELLVSEIEQAVADAALRLARHATAERDDEVADWAARQGLRAVPFDDRLWSSLVNTARRHSPTALIQALRDRAAVLGEEAGGDTEKSASWQGERDGLNDPSRGLER